MTGTLHGNLLSVVPGQGSGTSPPHWPSPARAFQGKPPGTPALTPIVSGLGCFCICSVTHAFVPFMPRRPPSTHTAPGCSTALHLVTAPGPRQRAPGPRVMRCGPNLGSPGQGSDQPGTSFPMCPVGPGPLPPCHRPEPVTAVRVLFLLPLTSAF